MVLEQDWISFQYFYYVFSVLWNNSNPYIDKINSHFSIIIVSQLFHGFEDSDILLKR